MESPDDMTPADQAVEALLAEMRSAADSIEWRAGRPDLTPMTHRRLERLRRPQAVVAVLVVAAIAVFVAPIPQLHLFGATRPSLTPSARPGPGPIVAITTLSTPSPRSQTVMAYFPPAHQIVLFGGQANSPWVGLGDTWVFDTSGWHEVHPKLSPPALIDAAMAYDPRLRELVLFGGDTRTTPNDERPQLDTWVWNGVNWSELHPANRPTYLPVPVMAYDATTQELTVLAPPPGYAGAQPSGNFSVEPSSPPLGRWILTGTDWTFLSTSPAPPIDIGNEAFVQASRAGEMLYYSYNFPAPSCLLPPTAASSSGSCVRPDPSGVLYSNTWTWNGSRFTKAHPTQAPDWSSLVTWDPRLSAPIAIDRSGHVWTWDGASWRRQRDIGPVGGQAIAYDPVLGDVVVFGAGAQGDQTWLWSGKQWSLVTIR